MPTRVRSPAAPSLLCSWLGALHPTGTHAAQTHPRQSTAAAATDYFGICPRRMRPRLSLAPCRRFREQLLLKEGPWPPREGRAEGLAETLASAATAVLAGSPGTSSPPSPITHKGLFPAQQLTLGGVWFGCVSKAGSRPSMEPREPDELVPCQALDRRAQEAALARAQGLLAVLLAGWQEGRCGGAQAAAQSRSRTPRTGTLPTPLRTATSTAAASLHPGRALCCGLLTPLMTFPTPTLKLKGLAAFFFFEPERQFCVGLLYGAPTLLSGIPPRSRLAPVPAVFSPLSDVQQEI